MGGGREQETQSHKGGKVQGCITVSISEADGQRDSNKSTFVSVSPLELVPIFIEGWCTE